MFKAGDKVKCVNNYMFEGHLTVGKVYTVVNRFKGIDDNYLLSIKIDDMGRINYTYKEDRFELHIENKEEVAMFKVGDMVYDIVRGCGAVVEITKDTYPVRVQFSKYSLCYTMNGKYSVDDIRPSLYFEEIPIPETALVRPKWRAKGGDLYFYVDSDGLVESCAESYSMADDRRFEFCNYFQTREEAEESKFYKVFYN